MSTALSNLCFSEAATFHSQADTYRVNKVLSDLRCTGLGAMPWSEEGKESTRMPQPTAESRDSIARQRTHH